MTDGSVPVVPRLVLWRHGRTAWNATGRFQGQLDPPMDDEGRDQAARTAPYLVTELSAGNTVVVSSDLGRAAETAASLTALLGVPLTLDKRLREHGLGCWEGLTRAEVAVRFPEQYADWVAGRPVRGREGEPPEAVAARAVAALADLPPASVAVVVTHGGTAGRLLEALLGLGADHRRVFGPLGNCHWSELTWHAARWHLIRHNSSVLSPAVVGAAAQVGPALTAVPGSPTTGAGPGAVQPVSLGDDDAVG